MLHPSPPPFRKAILESGAPTARAVLAPGHPRTVAQVHGLLALAGARDAAALDALSLDVLLGYATRVWAASQASVAWPFQPVVDGPGGLIPDLPLNLWADWLPRHRSVTTTTTAPAVLTGFCSHEGAGFVPEHADTNEDFRRFFAKLIPAFSPDDLDALEALYPDPVTHPTSPYHMHHVQEEEAQQGRKGAQFRRLYEAYGHYAYICPILHTAHMVSRAGGATRVYVYEYAAVSGPAQTASHGSQAAVVAHDMAELPPALVPVARAMNSRWSAFAAAPDGRLADDVWPAFRTPFDDHDDEGRGAILVFGRGYSDAAPGETPVTTRLVTEDEKRICRFWWDRVELSEGMCERGAAEGGKNSLAS